VCVNKYDTNTANTEKIEAYCKDAKLDFVGKIPFDALAAQALNSRMNITDIDCPAGIAIKTVFANTVQLLQKENGV
jgi:MinD superfamily P-loop ATPase